MLSNILISCILTFDIVINCFNVNLKNCTQIPHPMWQFFFLSKINNVAASTVQIELTTMLWGSRVWMIINYKIPKNMLFSDQIISLILGIWSSNRANFEITIIALKVNQSYKYWFNDWFIGQFNIFELCYCAQ
jgi:hypothetical protein